MQGSAAGYSITTDVLSGPDCDALLDALSGTDAGTRSRAGIRHLMSHPGVAALAASDALAALAQQWLGPVAIPFRATLFEKSGASNWLIRWHQDTALPLAGRFEAEGWGPWSEKAGALYAHAPGWALARVIALRLHLDDSCADNGPLRVIPGSHLGGVLSDGAVAEYAATHHSVECLSPRGGVIAMRPLLIHSSSKSSSKSRSNSARRVLHIEYADSLSLGEGIRLAVV